MFAELAHKFSIRYSQNKLSKVEMGEARVLYLTWAKHNQLEGKIWEARYHEVMAIIWSRRINKLDWAPDWILADILWRNPRPVDPREKNFLAKVKKLLKTEQAKLESKPSPNQITVGEVYKTEPYKGLRMSSLSTNPVVSVRILKPQESEDC